MFAHHLHQDSEVTPSQKFQAVNAVASLILEGKTPNQACAITGLSRSNYERWSKALALAEGNAWEAFAERRPTGRPTIAEFTPEETAIARWHRLTKDSLPVAVYFFLQDERIRPDLKESIRNLETRALENGTRAHYPPSIRRAFHVTDEDRAAFRGGKAPQNTELVTRRSLDWIDAAGNVHTFLPGQLWEMDDYSANQPFAYPDLETGEIRTGRQVLAALDVATAGWLSFDAIGRPKDAYRGEDILRFIERSFRAHGMPLFLRLERGSWDSSYIHGIDVPDLITGWGALDALVNIQHVWKSKGKGTIEGSFDPLQTWLSHASLDIGRHRGEFAAQTKAMRQAANSATLDDVRRLGLWEQAEAIAAHEEAARIMNSRPRRRDIIAPGKYISADDLRAQQGWHTAELPESEAWRFYSCKRKATIAGGIITINPGNGYPETSFVCNGVDGRHFDNGYQVLVAFDPAQPELGAYIANADRSHRNVNAIPIGEKLITAPMHNRAPQINLSGKQHQSISLRKAASAAATTEFRAIKSGSGNSNLRVTAAGDGQGRRIEITNQPRNLSETPATTSANLRETTPAPSPRVTTPTSTTSPRSTPSLPIDRLAALRAAEANALNSL
jgi:hypothetical protein